MKTASSIARAMQSFVIEGGRPLSGTVRASGNKNGALPILAACVLASEEVRLSNVPRIRDVETMVELLADLGADVEWTGPNEVRVDPERRGEDRPRRRARARDPRVVPPRRAAARALRARHRPAAGRRRDRPAAARHARPRVRGARRRRSSIDGVYELSADGLRGTRMYLDEASVMGTENAIMAAVLAEGETVLGHAACEPHIQDLCRFLVSLGAHIEGIGSNVLHIDGRRRARRRRVPDRPGPHRGRELRRRSRRRPAARSSSRTSSRTTSSRSFPRSASSAIEMEVSDSSVRVPPGQDLHVEDDFGGQIPKIESGIWPAFPADLTSIAVTVATQAHGTILIFEKMFESRLFFVDKLVSMGARIILCDPHRVVVTGPAHALRRAAREPGHPRRHGDAHRGALRRGDVDDREHPPDRPRLRAHRRAPARPRRRRSSAPSCDERGRGARSTSPGGASQRRARASPCSTTCSRSSPTRAGSGSRLEIAPDEPEAEVGRGRARRSARRSRPLLDARGAPAAASASRRPTRRWRWSSSRRRAGRSSSRTPTSPRRAPAGCRPTSPRRSSTSSREAAGLTIHVRLIEGEDSQHVLSAIFKALGIALADACERDGGRAAWPRRTSSAPTGRPARSRARRTTRRSGSATSSSSRASSGSRSRRARSPGRRRRADGADHGEPRRDPRRGGQRARQAREDDGLPHGSRRLRGDERGLRDATSAIARPRARRCRSRGFRAARSSRSRRSARQRV